MFTVEQIAIAHSQVESGADFPVYIQKIKQMGVTAFETWVTDSHTVYFGENDYQIQSGPMYNDLAVATNSNKAQFEYSLQIHQQGKTDYATFCKDCAATGIERWFVSLDAMTCTYYNTAGNVILIEPIPG